MGLTKISGDHGSFLIFFSMIDFRTYFKANFIIDSRTYEHHQVVLSNW